MLFKNLNNYLVRTHVSLLTEKSPLPAYIVSTIVDRYVHLHDILSGREGVFDGLNNLCKNSYFKLIII